MAFVDLAIEEFDSVDQLILHLRLFCLYQKAKDFVVVSFDEGVLVVIDNSDVRLERPDYFSKKSIFLYDVLLQLSVDTLKTHLVIPLRLAFHLHDLPDRVNEPMLKLTGRFNILNLFVKKHSLHIAFIIRKSFEQLNQMGKRKKGGSR